MTTLSPEEQAAMPTKEKILVVGGAGYLGSVLVRKLLDHGYRVSVLDNLLHGDGPILPLEDVILPIATYDYPYRRGLCYNSFLRTRTGRSMPYEPRGDGWFQYGVLRGVEIDGEHMDQLIRAWKEQDLAGVTEELGYFRKIDYIIVDSSAADWIQDRLPGYRRETAVGRFTVLSRARAATNGGDPWS